MKAKYQIKGETDRIALQDAIPLATPLHVFLETANICNFKCSFCFHREGGGGEAMRPLLKIMPYELAKKCIDGLGGFPEKIKLLSLFNNGEPLLNKRLPEIIAYAKKSGFADKLDITTNASLFTHELADKIIDSGIDLINISIYGLSGPQYKTTTSVMIDFKAFLENLQYLYDNRKQCVIAIKIMDAMFKSVDDEKYFYDLFSNICDRISVEKIVPLYDDIEYSDDIKKENKTIYGGQILKKNVCPLPFYSLIVHPNGDVSPCCPDWSQKIIIGNANNESLKEIWDSGHYYRFCYRQLEIGRKNVPECDGCNFPDFATLDNIDEYRNVLLQRYTKID